MVLDWTPNWTGNSCRCHYHHHRVEGWGNWWFPWYLGKWFKLNWNLPNPLHDNVVTQEIDAGCSRWEMHNLWLRIWTSKIDRSNLRKRKIGIVRWSLRCDRSLCRTLRQRISLSEKAPLGYRFLEARTLNCAKNPWETLWKIKIQKKV